MPKNSSDLPKNAVFLEKQAKAVKNCLLYENTIFSWKFMNIVVNSAYSERYSPKRAQKHENGRPFDGLPFGWFSYLYCLRNSSNLGVHHFSYPRFVGCMESDMYLL